MRLLLWFGMWSALIVSFMGLLAPFVPFLDIVNHFRPFLVVGIVLLAGLSYGMGLQKLAKGAMIIVIVNSFLLLPALFNQAEQTTETFSQGKKKHSLTLLTMNMWGRNKSPQKVIDLILEQNPDIVMLQEFFAFHANAILPVLKKHYPYVYSCSGERSCNLAIASKTKWDSVSHVGWTPEQPPLIDAVFSDKHILVTHTAYPFHPQKQQSDMAWLAKYIKQTAHNLPVIIGGDLNLSPWSWKMFQFQYNTGLRRHTTFLLSWPAHQFWPFVQLDHILTTPMFKTLSVKTLSGVGSDHLPVLVKIKNSIK